ncbi:hypothetical protein TNCV_4029541 [Trichonephila clavipes]|nr:hypothetical protein TNCV_4029541 [Trichonephila clavipes]
MSPVSTRIILMDVSLPGNNGENVRGQLISAYDQDTKWLPLKAFTVIPVPQDNHGDTLKGVPPCCFINPA